MNLTDDWDADMGSGKKAIRCPDATLLDEKWYAMELDGNIRLFYISTDPGMKHDLSADHPDLAERAKSEFQTLKPR